MGKIKELMEDLFNKKMGDYEDHSGICDYDGHVGMGEVADSGLDPYVIDDKFMEQAERIYGQCPIVKIPPSPDTICLPSGTNHLNQASIDEAMKKHTNKRSIYSSYIGATHSTVAGGWVDNDGNRCDEYGEPLSALDENGWRRE